MIEILNLFNESNWINVFRLLERKNQKQANDNADSKSDDETKVMTESDTEKGTDAENANGWVNQYSFFFPLQFEWLLSHL